jgi:chemotaxis signal transduction protein
LIFETRKPVPHYGQQIVVQSQLEADLQRELRREKKRQGRELNRLTHMLGDERLAIEVANIEHIRQV